MASQHTLRATLSVVTLAALATVAACGGGGSSTSAQGEYGFPSAGTLQAGVAAGVYLSSDAAGAYFAALNTLRTGAGAGQVEQDKNADVAAQRHADYLVGNLNVWNVENPYEEVVGRTGFSGTTLAARFLAAGIPAGSRYSATELISAQVGSTSAEIGAKCLATLQESIYVTSALLMPATRVGVGVALDGYGGGICVADIFALEVKYPAPEAQIAPSGSLATFPNAGATVPGTYDLRARASAVLTTLMPQAQAGTPVVAYLRNADVVRAVSAFPEVTQFTLRNAAGQLVPAVLIRGKYVQAGAGVVIADDSEQMQPLTVALVPVAPLAPGQYSASLSMTVEGTTNGAIVGTPGAKVSTKTWTFTAK